MKNKIKNKEEFKEVVSDTKDALYNYYTCMIAVDVRRAIDAKTIDDRKNVLAHINILEMFREDF